MDQTFVLLVLGATLAFLMWGRWRYDLVALTALLVLTVAGIIPGRDAFLGFGHPAVVTVAAVLILGQALTSAGLVTLLSDGIGRVAGSRPALQIPALTVIVAVLSSFVNNVGALALLLPVALGMARESGRSASVYLMPLAFGSLLGGLVTLIGTPPNIIIATFRAEELGEAFRMFDFAPVGLGVAFVGTALIAIVGWRLLPERQATRTDADPFDIDSYVSEVRVTEESAWAGRRLGDLREEIADRLVVIGIVRTDGAVRLPSEHDELRPGDVLVVEAEPADLRDLMSDADLEREGESDLGEAVPELDQFTIVEAVVRPESRIAGRSARDMRLRSRHRLNLLGVARRGQRVRGRLAGIRLRPGDLILVQGEGDAVERTLNDLGALVIREREMDRDSRRHLVVGTAVFVGAIGAMVAGWMEAHIALGAAAVAVVFGGLVPARRVYDAVDWPVIVLVGAMLPVGEALETTGAASELADWMLVVGSELSGGSAVAMLLITTMLLSNTINNAAAAVLMAPIAVSVAGGMDLAIDPFLMAVAVGASSAFLTPIGHQSNTLVMGPGGYRFSDYLYLGIPISIVVPLVATPLILWFWPV